MEINFNKEGREQYLGVPQGFRNICRNVYDFEPPSSCNINWYLQQFNVYDIVSPVETESKRQQYGWYGERMIPIPLKRGPKTKNEYEKEAILIEFLKEKINIRKDKYRDECNLGELRFGNPYYMLDPTVFENRVNSIVTGTNGLIKYFGVCKDVYLDSYKANESLYKELLLCQVELNKIKNSLSNWRNQIVRYINNDSNIIVSDNALLLVDYKYENVVQRIDEFLDVDLNSFDWNRLVNNYIEKRRYEYIVTDNNMLGDKRKRLEGCEEQADEIINKFTIFNNPIENIRTQQELKESISNKFKKPIPRNLNIIPAKEIKIVRNSFYEKFLKKDKNEINYDSLYTARKIINADVVNKLTEKIPEWCKNEITNDKALRFKFVIDNCIKI